jgi:hypothetical protein
VLLWKLAAPEKAPPQDKPAPQAKAKELKQCWETLTENDPEAVYPAMWAMARTKGAAVAFLQKCLQPAGPRDPTSIPQLVDKLNGEKPQERETARTELLLFRSAAEPALFAALRGKLALPMRVQVEKLLAIIAEYPIAPEDLQKQRGVQVLEWVGTPEAVALLEDLASGHATAPLTRDAGAALRRLTLRRQIEPVRLQEARQP